MPYVDFAGLSRFDGKLKDFASSGFAGLDMANWQKTAVAGAVSFSPVPEMPLDPVVSFLFTESGPASGTKGPDNPSTITGVSSVKVTRCGKNLAIMSPGIEAAVNAGNSYTINGVIFTPHSDGSYTANGTAEGASADFYPCLPSHSGGVKLVPGQTYTLSGCPSGGSSSTYSVRMYPNDLITCHGDGVSFISSVSNSNLYIRINKDVHVENLVFHPQIELGNAATAFESPVLPSLAHHDIPLGLTYYGGSIDLATGLMTVTHYYTTISQSYNLSIEQTDVVGVACRIPLTGDVGSQDITCEELPFAANQNNEEHIRFQGGGDSIVVYIAKSRLTYTTNWVVTTTAWLTANPIHIVYKLVTPLTVQLTPLQIYSLSQSDPYAPRINTVYSDQVSVQVGYPKSPQASQTELTNAIVSLGGNV